MAKDNFGQTVKAMTKGAGGIGKAVSAAAKAKPMPAQAKNVGKGKAVGKAAGKGMEDTDSKILRTMPISETHLSQIKKHYGVK